MEDIELQPLDEARQVKTQGSDSRWFGRIRVITIFGRECFIGPHWLFSIALLAIMISLVFIFTMIAKHAAWFHIPVGAVMIVASFATFLNLMASDPGVLGRPSCTRAAPFVGQEQLFPSSGGRDCTICDITQPNGSLHCEYCNVCVEGYDHHCPWTSKCIGKKNLQDFHIFLATGMSTMLYIILVVAFTRP
eukprot:GEMP01036164.1.p1 GENE.GEMP01036164.1~~GEMP01036164.1.p1  ORF type:complete len:191 (+),score=17.48 GEMP01036164.1:3-575(+)